MGSVEAYLNVPTNSEFDAICGRRPDGPRRHSGSRLRLFGRRRAGPLQPARDATSGDGRPDPAKRTNASAVRSGLPAGRHAAAACWHADGNRAAHRRAAARPGAGDRTARRFAAPSLLLNIDVLKAKPGPSRAPSTASRTSPTASVHEQHLDEKEQHVPPDSRRAAGRDLHDRRRWHDHLLQPCRGGAGGQRARARQGQMVRELAPASPRRHRAAARRMPDGDDAQGAAARQGRRGVRRTAGRHADPLRAISDADVRRVGQR